MGAFKRKLLPKKFGFILIQHFSEMISNVGLYNFLKKNVPFKMHLIDQKRQYRFIILYSTHQRILNKNVSR